MKKVFYLLPLLCSSLTFAHCSRLILSSFQRKPQTSKPKIRKKNVEKKGEKREKKKVVPNNQIPFYLRCP